MPGFFIIVPPAFAGWCKVRKISPLSIFVPPACAGWCMVRMISQLSIFVLPAARAIILLSVYKRFILCAVQDVRRKPVFIKDLDWMLREGLQRIPRIRLSGAE